MFVRRSLRSFLLGEKLVNFLSEPKKGTKWPDRLPKFASRQEAIAVCKELVKLEYIVRAEKRGKGELGVRVSAAPWQREQAKAAQHSSTFFLTF